MNRPADEHNSTDDALTRHRDELKKRFPLPSPPQKTRHHNSTSGVLAVLMVLAGGLFWLDPAYRRDVYSSTAGQVQRLELDDGSRVTLDGASQIEVSWHLRSRRVALQTGQALFDVAPALYRPFRTLAGSTEITVLGTRYNVSRLADSVRISVVEGRVGVRGQTTEQLLSPGHQLLSRSGQLGEPTQVDAQALSDWTEGRLVFERTPLIEVLDTLERQQNTAVHLATPDLAQLPVSGTFDRANLGTLLTLLPQILPVELHTATDGTLSLSRRNLKK
ncbi:FecR family protein [Pseudomonas anguilliseptica]|uniref:FecR family protein n=1 Tax=Pseudomonas anguilliseptica TaxID=53406 RepID=UPI0037350893